MANGTKCREEVRQDKNQQCFICLFIKEFIDTETIGWVSCLAQFQWRKEARLLRVESK